VITDTKRNLAAAVVGAAGIIAVVALYQRAEVVVPQVHFRYTQALQQLREADAQTDAELLATRMQLSRNYDALTAQVARARQLGGKVAQPPEFLGDEDRRALLTAGKELVAAFADKAQLVDDFKRANAVLHNSLDYFPRAGEELMAIEPPVTVALAAEHYMRAVLNHVASPGNALQPVEQAAEILRRHSADPHVATLLRHGKQIVDVHRQVDAATLDALGLQSGQRLDQMATQYARGFDRAQQRAGAYRRALYAVMVVLAAYLGFLFYSLEQARRRLADANLQLQERYQAQLRAEERLRLHATAFDNAYEGMTLTDVEGTILEVNPAFTRITGYERSEVIGRNPRVLKSGRHGPEFYAAMWQSIVDKGNWRGEIWNRGKYGDVYPELLSISAVRDEQGHISNYVAVFADISRIKEQEKQLTQMAYFDALTGLPNRVLLADRMTLSAAQTRRGSQLMAVCYLDLDGFKVVNDTWGHETGDQLLIEMAGRLKAFLRGGDTVARLGGDEFVVLLVGMSNVDECERAVERMLAVIGQPLRNAPEPVSLSASIGVTVYPFDDGDVEALLRHADQAMYRAKQSGKNCYLVFDPVQDRHTRSRYDRLQQIQEALASGQLVLHYQPVADLRRGRIVSCEALIRWQHPERGLLSPDEFLPLTVETDLADAIGEWVVETALQQVNRWQLAGCDVQVSVNLTGHHLQKPSFAQRLTELVSHHPGLGRALQIEVVETAAIEDLVKVSQVIEQCRRLDVSFALDDFGTGYSSLTYLKRLPVKTIKIDRGFVSDMLGDANNLAIVQGILALARAFQRTVVAEGVETIDQGRLLMQLGCDLAQGYAIAAAMPGDLLPDWLARWRPDPAWRDIAGLRWDSAHNGMLVAEVELRNWVGRVTYALREEQPLPRDALELTHLCGFGAWYEHIESRRYADFADYGAMRQHHERLHEIVAQADAMRRDGRAVGHGPLVELIQEYEALLAHLLALQLAVASPA
jgi:diguanylate cyclase (GGDEF)-like protein/PAS domain S-box-containing protein